MKQMHKRSHSVRAALPLGRKHSVKPLIRCISLRSHNSTGNKGRKEEAVSYKVLANPGRKVSPYCVISSRTRTPARLGNNQIQP